MTTHRSGDGIAVTDVVSALHGLLDFCRLMRPSFIGASSFPESKEAARTVFSLPMHPYLEESVQSTITEALLSEVASSPERK